MVAQPGPIDRLGDDWRRIESKMGIQRETRLELSFVLERRSVEPAGMRMDNALELQGSFALQLVHVLSKCTRWLVGGTRRLGLFVEHKRGDDRPARGA